MSHAIFFDVFLQPRVRIRSLTHAQPGERIPCPTHALSRCSHELYLREKLHCITHNELLGTYNMKLVQTKVRDGRLVSTQVRARIPRSHTHTRTHTTRYTHARHNKHTAPHGPARLHTGSGTHTPLIHAHTHYTTRTHKPRCMHTRHNTHHHTPHVTHTTHV